MTKLEEAARMAQIDLQDPELDATDPHTRMLLLAEHWKREAMRHKNLTDMQNEELLRTWFVLKEYGHHPGRTDDRLSDCVRRALGPKEAHRAALAEHEAAPPREPGDDLMAELQAARDEATFYRRRCESLQQWQSHMRDPERTIVCDILANGHTLPAEMAGNRYKAPPRELSEELLRVWPLEDWHEDDGPAMWWRPPVDEPPYCGTPLDSDWPGYHTHWSRIIIPAELVKDSPAPSSAK